MCLSSVAQLENVSLIGITYLLYCTPVVIAQLDDMCLAVAPILIHLGIVFFTDLLDASVLFSDHGVLWAQFWFTVA